jgi:hypothetical protein
MHWKTELALRVESSLFTNHGVISLDHVAIRNFDTPLVPESGWHFHKGCGKGWSGPYKSKAHARAELALHLLDEEDMLVRALTGVADFTHAPWLKTRRAPTRPGNDGVVFGYYRIVGEHLHVIRFHDGFISALAVKLNRIERIPRPAIQSALMDSDSFLILKVEGDSMAQTIAISPADPVTILPATVEEEGLFGMTARSIREAIEMLDGLDHDGGDES